LETFADDRLTAAADPDNAMKTIPASRMIMIWGGLSELDFIQKSYQEN
jgi:hypothetical protein